MHALTYQFKRASLSAIAMGRRLFKGTKLPNDPDFDGVLDMTPARFDILYLVMQYQRQHYGLGPLLRDEGMAMTAIRSALGLHRATISKGIARLEELGLVTTHGNGGRGGIFVRMTAKGLLRMRRALQLVFNKEFFPRIFQALFGKRMIQRERLSMFWYMTVEAARHLGDRSRAIYLHRPSWDSLWMLVEP